MNSEPVVTASQPEKSVLASESQPAASQESNERLPVAEKIAVGAGGLTGFLGNVGVNSTAIPFYQMSLGVNPALLGIVLAIPRFWDAITDPVMGNLSDNFQSRFGRRRPFILLGALLMAVSFGMIWMVPQHWSEVGLVTWFLVTSLIFYTCFTIFAVPFQSLTYEMTPNYDERTSVMGYVTFGSKMGEFGYQWFVPAASLAIFASLIDGVRWVCWIVAIVCMAMVGSLPALLTKERFYKVRAAQRPKSKFWQTVKETLKSGSFRILLALALLQIVAAMFTSSLDYYLLVYYMFDGDIAQGSVWKGILSSGYAICGFLGIPVVVYWTKRSTKKTVLTAMYGLVILNSIFRWFIYQPGNQAFIFIDPILGSFFWIGVGTIMQSMMADVCDEDELKYGHRREGMFGAVFGWITKTALSLSFLASGLALTLVGFDEELGGNQSDGTFLGIRLLMVFGAIIPSIIGLVILQLYPITREKAAATRDALEQRRGSV